ncbi:MAG TPA: ATP-binding protein [Stellaceae bacterium]|jgi:lon-related putative ATP-dependent protease|nr:ATP-binding protein [Stellaceae bacterium]
MADPDAQSGAPLPAVLLARRCRPEELPFQLSSELPDAPAMIGQDRAAEAVAFALRMRHKGYNVYALGPAGVGRHALVEDLLKTRAATESAASDWCYVNNFTDPQSPHCLDLPAGQGAGLAQSMRHLVEELRIALPAAFENNEYRARREIIDQHAKSRSEEAFGGLQERADAKEIALIRTPMGLALAPKRDGKVMNPEDFEALPEEERKRIEGDLQAAQIELEGIMRQVPQWEREHREAVRTLNRDITGFAVAALIGELRGGYADLPDVLEYLDAVEHDIKENVDDFLPQPQPPAEAGPAPPAPAAQAAMEDMRFRRYQVNVIVDNGGSAGAPVIYEDNPTYQNLIGRVEHLARFGALITDFNLIQAGALQRANGGYLILDAERLVASGYGWPALKRALQSSEIRIESIEQAMSLATTVSLQPEPIPLDVKIVLIGSPLLYYVLSQRDEDFAELFKIAADFDDRLARSDGATMLYARVIATIVRREHLRALDRDAVARVIEQAARLAGDSDRLSMSLRAIVELLQEADQLAADAGKEVVGAAQVQAALDAQTRRGDRVYRRMQEEIGRRTIRIETDGEIVGQINGLSVISLGALSFGNPTRITAQVRMGRGEVVDIEREVQLGGPLHSKGVLILTGFLGGRFGGERPLSLHASLVFEQSYGGVDGDSASAAELFALLSAIAEVPIQQCFAVTGSVDQHGIIQAIGGVNEKIEGFFDICNAAGLTGKQGCIIPASNVRHLMLRADMVAACEAGKFRVIPMETIDQGLELLTGVPTDTTNKKIAARLDDFTAKAAALLRSQTGAVS